MNFKSACTFRCMKNAWVVHWRIACDQRARHDVLSARDRLGFVDGALAPWARDHAIDMFVHVGRKRKKLAEKTWDRKRFDLGVCLRVPHVHKIAHSLPARTPRTADFTYAWGWEDLTYHCFYFFPYLVVFFFFWGIFFGTSGSRQVLFLRRCDHRPLPSWHCWQLFLQEPRLLPNREHAMKYMVSKAAAQGNQSTSSSISLPPTRSNTSCTICV